MIWTSKEYDMTLVISDIEKELDANVDIIPAERVADVRHYLSHGEISMAFEYLYLEIMERSDCRTSLDLERVKEIATILSLDDELECMIDHEFWGKLMTWLSHSQDMGS